MASWDEGLDEPTAAPAEPEPQGRAATDNNFSSSEQLHVSLTLPGHPTMRHIDGRWVSDAKPAPEVPAADLPTVERMAELLRRIDELESRLREARDEMEADKEEKALLSLRNKMLVEMLAVSQLDTGRALDELKTERLRVEALKWELARVTLNARTGRPIGESDDTAVTPEEADRLSGLAAAAAAPEVSPA
ncbi:hypothetical protein FNF27_04322 [Cafeteria roenbergensis]|uniref:Uncharacterized protein n=2 Tax=Cafeteria roenbergensis TaxID=33653 RepID=A0A5A8CNU1_CAFRO|nr:hypothetical protein FNF29_02754 [Cafeteria roenbergensis]KAA0166869.1 hypothetical protein FNF31_01244 [Cafeteria roenbergensis]KAA0169465.1 hypothetical protein FNF28_02077 [Cafeteria roenbergensis]KAA0174311.1 hypothetical protein FNF27_04322 [Cafeteria roenbergensis]|eukprot:KAA0154134.1 hypothetical protein FNF29_02754 [Cafeteria roenbergensis]